MIKNVAENFIRRHKVLLICFSIILLILIFSLNFSVLVVSGQSMEPNLHNGDLLFSRKTFMSLDRFNIIVCLDDTQAPIIKRIVGLPGEKIEYKNNKLFINGEELNENYSIGNTEDFSIEIDENNYFCLGDNREHSRDSRSIGQINRKDIVAEVF